MKFWSVRLASIAAVFAVCFGLEAFAQGQTDFIQRLMVLAGLYVTLAVSLNLINGITGQFSIGHAAFYQVGAYTAGYLATRYYGHLGIPGLPWLLLMIPAGALMAAVAGLLVGLPSLRLRGDYLAIVTLGFGEIIRIVAQNQAALGGAYGMSITPRFQYVWLVWLLAFVCIAVCRNLLKTAHGLPFLAVREDEVAAAAMGVNVTRTKVTAFLLGSAFAGAAGALLAHFEGFVSPAMFTMDVSFIIVTMVVLGGTGSITGATLAAILLFYLPEKMRDLTDVPLATLVAIGLTAGCFVALVRQVMFHYHGPLARRVMLYVGLVAGAFVTQWLVGLGLKQIPALTATVEGARLRLVVFAVTLIMLMLIRPQGVLAHHEFSWDFLRRMLRLGKHRAAESAP